MKTHWCRIGTVSIAAIVTSAAVVASGVSGPSLGYLYDSNSRTLTAVLGVAGSSVRGAAISLPGGVTALRMAPGQNYGIGILEDGSVALVEVSGNGISTRVLAGTMANPDQIIFGSSGTSALLYSATNGRLQVVVNPGAAVQIRETVATGATALAVSDDGAWTVFANSGGLWTVDAAGALRRVSGESGIQTAAFRPGTSDLVFATSSALYGISAASGPANPVLIRDGLDGILAVAESADGAHVFASTTSGVMVIDTADGVLQTVGCDCEVTSFEALTGGNAFRLSDVGTGPTYVFDSGSAGPRVVFVPGQAPAEDNSTEGGAQ